MKENTERCLIALTCRQKDSLDLLARQICRSREKGGDKITTSSIIRCLIELFFERWDGFDCESIYTEEDLLAVITDKVLRGTSSH